MTPEELLKPRYKVLDTYPESRFFKGEILINNDGKWVSEKIDGVRYIRYDLDQYPHLFKKLKWWEERKVEDIKYFRNNYGVWKVEEPIKHYAQFNGSDFQPATEEEYNAQNKS